MSISDVVTMPIRFDYSASDEFNTRFGAALTNGTSYGKTVILDCMKLEYIDSAGMGLLIVSHKKAQCMHAEVAMINLKALVKETLLLANIQKIIDLK